MSAFLYGLAVGFSLILAIGAQNAFVLKQGLKNSHIFWVCLVCSLSDAILMVCGVTGFAKVIEQYPMVVVFAKYFGAMFLFCYGLVSFISALNNNNALVASGDDEDSLFKVIVICLSFTWLNPHVYLDTLILIGSISTQFPHHTFEFTMGTVLASLIFFFSLGYGARRLRPIFETPKAWRLLDGMIGIVMWVIAVGLLWS